MQFTVNISFYLLSDILTELAGGYELDWLYISVQSVFFQMALQAPYVLDNRSFGCVKYSLALLGFCNVYLATLASDLKFGSQLIQINHSYLNEKALTYLRSSPPALQNSFIHTMASRLTERSIQRSLSFCDYRFRNKGGRN